MNSKNKILVGCLALLLVLSVGYALFSDTITINGTASAKGSFDITAACQTGISSELGTVESLGLAAEGGYENDSCDVNDDEVTMNVNFLYPGARRYFTWKATNNGTIDSTLNLADIESASEMCVAENIEGKNLYCSSGGNYIMGFYSNITYSFAGIEDPQSNMLTETEMSEFVSGNTLTLKPDYSAYIIFTSTVKDDLTTARPTEESKNQMFVSFTKTWSLPFKQATN